MIPERFWCFSIKIFIFPPVFVSAIAFSAWYIICATDTTSDVENLTFYSLVVLVAHIQVGTKVCTFIWSREWVKTFLDWFEEFYALKEKNLKMKKIIEDQLTSTLNAAKTCSKYRDSFIYRFPGTSDEPSSALHLILLQTYQSAVIFLNTFLVFICDSTIAMIGFHIMGLLRILSKFILLLEDSFDACSEFLCRIQSLHCEIINRSRAFNDLLFHLLLVQLFSSIFLIFMNLSAIRSDAVGFVFYFLGGSSITQLLLICLFGEVIFMRYSLVERCLRLTTWYEMSLEDQKKFVLILRMAQKPYGLKAGGMYDVSMPTFIEIMKLAISYCAILFTIIE
uniref:Uncharacterized protein n=1 Tax=Lutzomyia longipalpis TaxID=7200 RepID=A0A3F2ZDA9_LUTLO